MADTKPKTLRRIRLWWRGVTLRQIRLASGIVLFAYLTTHFLNHALGVISLDALDQGRAVFLAVWRNWVGTVLLYGALLVHFLLALHALYARRRLRMSGSEALQYALGLTVPFLLASHVFATRGVHEIYGVDDHYVYVLLNLWVFLPWAGVQQVCLFLFAWVHGCMGLHFYMRLKPWYRAWQPWLYAGALIVPVLGLLGYYVSGRDVIALARDPEWLAAVNAQFAEVDIDAAFAFVYGARDAVWLAVLGLLAGVVALRGWRRLGERRRGLVRVTYPGPRTIAVAPGPTVLDISHLGGVPHASVCGGRGRCSTCRVRVGVGGESLALPGAAESAVLTRVGAPPNVRLACQIRPRADLEVTPLLPPNVGPSAARTRPGYLHGRERELVILFADLRAFTKFSESKLPYDVVFVLNRYFRAMGTAIEAAGGHVDKFIGDGVMAIFGIERGVDAGAREALVAARKMAEHLDELNALLGHDLAEPLRIGIGLHAGPVIVGEMGYAHATSLTAIGDAVNTASRLEAMTKEFGAQLVLSAAVERHAAIDLGAFPAEDVAIRGRTETLRVRIVDDAKRLEVAVIDVNAPEREAEEAAPRETPA